MNIVIDNRNNNSLYVDKVNNHIAKSDEIIKLTNNKNISNLDAYINILAGNYNLNKNEIAVLKYIMNKNNCVLSTDICKDVAKITNKSIITISRALNSIIKNNLAYINIFNEVYVSTNIDIDSSNIEKVKFIIIELRPEITSNNITL